MTPLRARAVLLAILGAAACGSEGGDGTSMASVADGTDATSEAPSCSTAAMTSGDERTSAADSASSTRGDASAGDTTGDDGTTGSRHRSATIRAWSGAAATRPTTNRTPIRAVPSAWSSTAASTWASSLPARTRCPRSG